MNHSPLLAIALCIPILAQAATPVTFKDGYEVAKALDHIRATPAELDKFCRYTQFNNDAITAALKGDYAVSTPLQEQTAAIKAEIPALQGYDQISYASIKSGKVFMGDDGKAMNKAYFALNDRCRKETGGKAAKPAKK